MPRGARLALSAPAANSATRVGVLGTAIRVVHFINSSRPIDTSSTSVTNRNGAAVLDASIASPR